MSDQSSVKLAFGCIAALAVIVAGGVFLFQYFGIFEPNILTLPPAMMQEPNLFQPNATSTTP